MLINSSLLILSVFQILISGSQTKPHATPIEDAECPSPWFSIGKQCFRVVKEESLSWASARNHCNAVAPCGGDLAQPNDVKAMADYLNDKGYPNGYDSGYWLGGSDQTTEGEWRWINNSTITAATGWGHREPNDEYSCEDCLSMRPGWGAANSLKDEGCGRIQHFICERHLCPTKLIAGCPAEFFTINGTNQCFKLLPEVSVTNHIANGIILLPFPGIKNPMGGSTMEESQSRCRDQGLVLAQPTHESAFAVNRHILKTYGEVNVWVGARRATLASEVLWLEQTGNSTRNSSIRSDSGDGDASSSGIPRNSPLWRLNWGPDKSFWGDNEWLCVIMLVKSWTPMGKPYQMQPCDSNTMRPLCQDVRSRSSSSLLRIPTKIGC